MSSTPTGSWLRRCVKQSITWFSKSSFWRGLWSGLVIAAWVLWWAFTQWSPSFFTVQVAVASGIVTTFLLCVFLVGIMIEATRSTIRDDLHSIVRRFDAGHETVDKIVQPVVGQCVNLATGTQIPLAKNVRMTLKWEDVGSISCGGDGPAVELIRARITRKMKWQVSVSGSPLLSKLLRPVMVCTDKVVTDRKLREALPGLDMDFCFPIPAVWAEGVLKELQSQTWLTEPKITLEGKEQACVVHAWVPDDQEAEALATFLGLTNVTDSQRKALESAHEWCLKAYKFEGGPKPLVSLPTLVQDDEYFVAIKRGGEPLYRYEMPVTYPHFISQVCFELGNSMGSDYQLLPPYVGSPFYPKLDPDPAELGAEPVTKYTLTWPARGRDGNELAGATGAPFLPGHGVVFLWRKHSAAGE